MKSQSSVGLVVPSVVIPEERNLLINPEPLDFQSCVRIVGPQPHGELLKLGNSREFLDTYVKSMVSVDFFTVPTLRFQALYGFLLLVHAQDKGLYS